MIAPSGDPEEIWFRATSLDGSVTVTVRADGSVVRLDLADHARNIPLSDLSELILDTMRCAQAGIADEVSEEPR